ncbi:Catalase-2 [Hibiscus syriacus]|uniref:Catalase n=1 Tax=Hibiscus syriacus TaxID=106335 RepID=A0A6A3ABB3_HIBSY|nr:Catalase-2 [Hibiscus syriacus]
MTSIFNLTGQLQPCKALGTERQKSLSPNWYYDTQRSLSNITDIECALNYRIYLVIIPLRLVGKDARYAKITSSLVDSFVTWNFDSNHVIRTQKPTSDCGHFRKTWYTNDMSDRESSRSDRRSDRPEAKELKGLGASEFKGEAEEDLVVANLWLNDVKIMLDGLHCPEVEKLDGIISLLRGQTRVVNRAKALERAQNERFKEQKVQKSKRVGTSLSSSPSKKSRDLNSLTQDMFESAASFAKRSNISQSRHFILDFPLLNVETVQREQSVTVSQRSKGGGRGRNQTELSTQHDMPTTARVYNLETDENFKDLEIIAGVSTLVEHYRYHKSKYDKGIHEYRYLEGSINTKGTDTIRIVSVPFLKQELRMQNEYRYPDWNTKLVNDFFQSNRRFTTGKWNVCVSSCQRSTRASINASIVPQVPSIPHSGPPILGLRFGTTTHHSPSEQEVTNPILGVFSGPILLEDYHLVEKLANFDRELIPERVVHARGASAKGFFEVTHDISHLTCADFLLAPGVQTPLIVRFSTVIHELGSPETLRDPRGFAVKFYTREGNFDMVGNNFPVFFIRDGMKFPDMVHALKPNPKSHIQENWRIQDFFSHHPESLHMFTFLFDDIGIPQDYRHMDGSGVHTYTLINKAGKSHYVKFHWKPNCGVKNLLGDEAVRVGGANHSHVTQGLYDSIAAGSYPEWKLFIQIMDPADEDRSDFDPFDVTKTWPEDIFPLQPVGRMVLNKNIDNFFAENEQLAFCPSIFVPGIYYSDDQLLQTRIFSYSDTQRHRLGPICSVRPMLPNVFITIITMKLAFCPSIFVPGIYYSDDQLLQTRIFSYSDTQRHHLGPICSFRPMLPNVFITIITMKVNYFPSRYDPVRHAETYPIPTAVCSCKREKCMIEENNFKQPRERYRSFTPDRQERFVQRWIDALSDPRVIHEISNIWIAYWSLADKSLGQKLASRLSVRQSYC